MTDSVYLHGFASSPGSAKARFLGDGLRKYGTVAIPDLNEPDFTTLTVARMLEQVASEVARIPADRPVLLVGSSLGGYVATRFVADGGRADTLVLVAPALDLAELWTSGVSESDRAAWQAAGTRPIEHYGYGHPMLLHYHFYEEALTLPAYPDASRIPTLILHGLQDTVVPPRISETYRDRHASTTRLELLDTDHQMADALPDIMERIDRFLSER